MFTRVRIHVSCDWLKPKIYVNAQTAYLDFHGGRGQGSDLLLHAVSDAGEHGGAAGQHSVGVQVLTVVHVALHDAVVGGLMDTGRLHS